jgi:WD40 repeat protein
MRRVGECIHSFCPTQQFWRTPFYPLIWKAEVWNVLRLRMYHAVYYYHLSNLKHAQSPDGQRVAMSSETGQIYIFDLEAGSLTTTFTSHAKSVRSLAWSPDSSVRIAYLPRGDHV